MSLFLFGLYLIMLVVIGYVTYIRTKNYSDYSLAGRTNSKWITAISAEASDMSGWLLLGLPGMGFAYGYGVIWVLIGILGGTLFNWTVVANRLRTITEHYKVVTLTDFFEKRLNDRKGTISIISAVVVVLFMVINASAEIIGSGKLLNAAFGFDYNVGIIMGLVIVLIYTFLGGYLAVSWSNLVQGSVMFIALVLVPVVALLNIGGLVSFKEGLSAQDPNFFKFLSGTTGFWPVFALIMGGLGIGIGYPGQPHILTSFMAIKDPKEVKGATFIAMVWVGLTTYGAAIVGIVGRGLFPSLEDPEVVFLELAKRFFSAELIGIFAAAVMAAILSSVSAYLLVAAASFASNIFTRIAKSKDDKKLLWAGRAAIVVISLIAFVMSLSSGAVFTVALYAWGGLAACFGPLVLYSLYWKGLNKTGAVASMVVGMVTILVWYNTGLSSYIYELVPAVALSALTAYVVSKLTGGPDKETSDGFAVYLKEIRSGK
ncbi:MAG TPA: sodium/proline symporter [Bacillota bacterium]|nr:sodium/proline symporter [Bacillota bacterium]